MSKGKKSKQPKIENSQFDALINQLMSAEGAQKMKLLDALKQSYLNDLAVQQRKLDTADAVRNQLIAKNNKLEQKNVERIKSSKMNCKSITFWNLLPQARCLPCLKIMVLEVMLKSFKPLPLLPLNNISFSSPLWRS